MSSPRIPPALIALGLAGLAVGAPFVTTWGAIALLGAFVAATAGLAWPGRRTPWARRLGWGVVILAPLLATTGFTIRVAAPNVVAAGQNAAGRMAVASLRTLLWAQDRFIERHGRAGLLAELAGTRPDGLKLPVPVVRGPYRQLTPTATGQAASDGGYLFQVWVVDPSGKTWGDGGPLPPAGARAWRACAWPQAKGTTASFAYCVDQHDDVVQTDNAGAHQGYSGLERPMPADAPTTAPPGLRLLPGTGADGGEWGWWRGKQTRRSKAADGR
ncbi:MAG: hypothetical protein KC613_14125 [Myxococcales bacterium]|nr:hypothetical protein [Myxococcales bacterium]MCB9525874.1 hypothetical protein [Myxococcales bacterium]